MKFIVSLGFKKLPQAELKSFARTVQIKMSLDTRFVSSQAEIEELKIANDALTMAIAKADGGTMEDTVIKNECFRVVIDLLDDLAGKVNTLAAGNELIVLASGFKVVKQASPISEIPTPTFAELINNPLEGVVKAKWQCSDVGVNNYIVQYQIEGSEDWIIGGNPTAKEVLLSGIPSGAVIRGRVCVNGTRNRQSPWVYTLWVKTT